MRLHLHVEIAHALVVTVHWVYFTGLIKLYLELFDLYKHTIGVNIWLQDTSDGKFVIIQDTSDEIYIHIYMVQTIHNMPL